MKITEIVEEKLEPFLEKEGLELYYTEYVKEGRDWVLRIMVDDVTSDDCERISNFIAGELDKDDPVGHPYILEVSSPGLERELRTAKHFDDSIGRDVRATLYSGFEGRKKFEGELLSADEEVLRLMVDGEELAIPRDLVKKVNWVFRF